jgi:DNA-binding transcriptional regulator GbsR (MarR family)
MARPSRRRPARRPGAAKRRAATPGPSPPGHALEPHPSSPAPRGDALLDEVVQRVAQSIGGLIKFWGFGPHAGRVWAVLYLSPRPLSAPELAARLRMSAGLLSQTLTLLERWGVVTRFRAPGRKLLLHAGADDVWSTVTRVLSNRELGLVRDLVTLTDEAAAAARRARAAGADPRRVDHVERRVLALRRLARVGEALLAVLLAAGTLDLGRLRGAMRLVGQVSRGARP